LMVTPSLCGDGCPVVKGEVATKLAAESSEIAQGSAASARQTGYSPGQPWARDGPFSGEAVGKRWAILRGSHGQETGHSGHSPGQPRARDGPVSGPAGGETDYSPGRPWARDTWASDRPFSGVAACYSLGQPRAREENSPRESPPGSSASMRSSVWRKTAPGVAGETDAVGKADLG